MRCSGCKSRLPINFDFERCPRCGRTLSKGKSEVSSPSLKVDVGRGWWSPKRWAEGLHDALELTFSPRAGWERAAADHVVFLGQRSAVAVAAIVLSGLGALVTAIAMKTWGLRYGVEPYVVQRTWTVWMVALLPPSWMALGFAALVGARRVVGRLLPPVEDPAAARQFASRVAILGAVPVLVSSAAASLWVVADVGPLLAVAGAAYGLHSSFQGMYRGPGMLMNFDATTRKRMMWRLALPMTLAYAVLGAGGLILLILRDAA